MLGETETTHYCSCGGRLKITVPANDELYQPAKTLVDAYTALHEGHEPATAAQCAAARRRARGKN